MLRNCSGPSPAPLRTPPAFGGAPSGFEIAALRASGASPVGWPGRGRLRRSEGRLRRSERHPSRRRGPRRSGGLRVSLRSLPGRLPGLRCSSRRALRRSRFRCPLGFLSLSFPFVVPPFYQPPPPVSSPSDVSFATFLSTIRARRLPTRRKQGGRSFAYAPVTYTPVTYDYVGAAHAPVTYTPVTFTYEAVTYHEVTYSPVTFVSVTYRAVTYTYVVVTYGYVGKSCH